MGGEICCRVWFSDYLQRWEELFKERRITTYITEAGSGRARMLEKLGDYPKEVWGPLNSGSAPGIY